MKILYKRLAIVMFFASYTMMYANDIGEIIKPQESFFINHRIFDIGCSTSFNWCTKNELRNIAIQFIEKSQDITTSSLSLDETTKNNTMPTTLLGQCYYTCFTQSLIQHNRNQCNYERAKAESLLKQAWETIKIIEAIKRMKSTNAPEDRNIHGNSFSVSLYFHPEQKIKLRNTAIKFIEESQSITRHSLNFDAQTKDNSMTTTELDQFCCFSCINREIQHNHDQSNYERAKAESLLKQANETIKIIETIDKIIEIEM